MPVDIASGNVHLRVTEASIPGKIGVVWERIYSGDFVSRPPGPLGKGWTTPYFATLTRHAGGFELISPSGSRELLPDRERAVESGQVIRHLRANLEIFLQEGRYVVQSWGTGREVLRYIFAPSASPGPMRLASIECLTGHGLDLQWSDTGLLRTVRQRFEGRELRLTYDNQDLLRTVDLQSASGSTHLLARYEYAGTGQLTAAFDALGYAVHYDYDGFRRLARAVARDGGTYSYTYDRDGRCVRAVGHAGYDEKRLRFLSAARITEVTDSYGSTRRYYYLPDGQIASEWDPSGSEARTEYDDDGRIIARITPKGAATRYAYDDWGNVSKVTDPAGASYSIAYNQNHQPTIVVDPLGATWIFLYDSRGQLVSKANPLGGATLYEYYANGNLRSVTAPDGATTRYSYRDDGSLHQITSPSGDTRSLLFDDVGRPVMQINALGGTVQTAYDERGHVTEIRRPDGTFLRYRYDPAGNLIERTDGQGNASRYDWGSCGRLLRRTDPLGRTIDYEWGTEIDRLIAAVDESGSSFRLSYDTAGRIVEERSFDGRVRTFAYDPDGYVSSIMCGDERLDVSYDACGRLAMLHLPDGSVQRYEYDALGRMTAAHNTCSTVSYAYDPLGNAIEERQGDISIIATFDAAGRLLRRSSSLGFDARLSTDAAGRITDIALGNGAAFGFHYDPRGFEVSRTLPGGLSLNQERDERGRAVRQFVSPTRVVALASDVDGFLRARIARSYAYDGNGAPTAVRDRRAGTASYSYDSAEQVIAATYDTKDWETFEYTPTGSLGLIATPGGSARFEYGGGNRLLRSDALVYDYDASGRRIAKRSQDNPDDAWAYSWDALGRLRSVTTPAGDIWTYTYDSLGRRISKSGPPGTTRYVWSGDALLHAIDESGSVDTWLHDDTTLTPIAKIRDNKVFSVVPDRLGLPRELIDTAGYIGWSATYSAWGKAKVADGAQTDCPIRLPGQWYDAESGLHYNRYRYFDPDTGQFISQDPLGIDSGLNLYRYAPNALNFIDLLGLDICANKKKGDDFKDDVKDELQKAGLTVTEEVTIKVTVGPNGETVRTRVDLHVTDANGNVTLIETKASATAPFTDNQTSAGVPVSSLSGPAEYRTGRVAGVDKGDPVPANATVVTIRPGDPIPGTGPPPVAAPHPPPP
jgi:RHS repeat-associated protein